MAARLLSTKLNAPTPRAGAVPRARLLAQLERIADVRLALISAPPGFGKSTLLADWIAGGAGATAVAWVSLDAGDDAIDEIDRVVELRPRIGVAGADALVDEQAQVRVVDLRDLHVLGDDGLERLVQDGDERLGEVALRGVGLARKLGIPHALAEEVGRGQRGLDAHVAVVLEERDLACDGAGILAGHRRDDGVPAPSVLHAALEAGGQVVLRYGTPAAAAVSMAPAVAYPDNPNGSLGDVAGVCDPSGRVCGLMPHPERHIDPTQHPRWTREPARSDSEGLRVFQNAVRYFA